jgi:translocation and assembly module TamA
MLFLSTLRVIATIIIAALWVVASAQAQEENSPNTAPAPLKTASSEFRYEISIEGAPKGTKEKLLAITEAEKQKSNPPPTRYLLKRRLDTDAQTLVKALHAIGFYDAQATASLATDTLPYRATFTLTPGDAYILKSVRVVLAPRSDTTDVTLPNPDTLSLGIGGAVNYETIQNGRNAVRSRVYAANCLRMVRVRAHLRVDTSAKTAEAIYRVHAGKEARFGPLTVEGLKTVKQPYVNRKLTWQQGECYKPSKIEDLQVRLLQTNLFSTTDIAVAEEPLDNGEYPVTLTLRERPQRTIKAGIGFATEEGLDFKPSWEHRNLFGEGEKFTLAGTLSTFLQSIKGRLERPDFMRRDQTLVLESELAQATTDAYDSTSLSGLAQLSRPLDEHLTGALGVAYALKQVDDDGGNSGQETFSLLSFPGYLEHNTRDDALDPSRGHLLRADVEPYIETLNTGDIFVKTLGSARFYHRHETIPFAPTWAVRGTVGSIWGSANNDLPADERFYSGGGGSVRGYGYQLLGPINNGSPNGGRSLIEFSGELRLRVTESVGVVPFIDAGNVYKDIYPKFDGDLFYAAGLGLRYFTDFGPFRFDVAFPLDQREAYDDAYQIYLSFGQSF